ncbi:hypothetical protein RHMOL_Rhmol08G0069300 [Rhododendron molle]|uniref:Uncharacterized protein n=1 Tax=Rhododendron molle TaxID=49168 RepID=A0ACC0MMI8_RHOML|nr:hypothetical protein RHMOL_Rhmol08G0069300 [Rhododendron molle]
MGRKLLMLLLASFLLLTTRAPALSTVAESTTVEVWVTPPGPLLPTELPTIAPLGEPPVLPGALVKQPMFLPNPPALLPAEPPVPIKDCEPKCRGRCKRHLRRRHSCFWACMECCDKCNCVPPGIYGKRNICGTCYTGMTNRRGRPICP